MLKNVQTKLSVWHRVGVGAFAMLVIILSIAAGLLTRKSAVAQDHAPTRGVIGEYPAAYLEECQAVYPAE